MGMLSLDKTCPHCFREKAVLVGFAEIKKTNGEYAVSFLCRSCEHVVVAEVIPKIARGPHSHAVNSFHNIVIPDNKDFLLNNFYPQSRDVTVPEHCPERASKFFIEAKENVNRGNYETSVMLCRKVIDIATREILGEDSKKEQLSQRISMLHGKGKITEQMKDWAHIVRIDSNGAVHSDEEFSKEEAEEMIGFTEVFLIYSFTLPEMVKAKQVKRGE